MAEEQRPKLELLLESADESRPESIAAFYEELIRAEVVVPKGPPGKVELGALDAYEFLIAGDSEHPILPVFTSVERMREWAEGDFPSEHRSFLALARLAPTSLTIHLNPGADIGKEFDGWELGKLSLGKDALDELLFEICEVAPGSVDTAELPEEFRNVVPRWRAILDAYVSVSTAYCAAVSDPGGDQELILFGYDAPESEESIRQKLEEEIRSAAPAGKGLRVMFLDSASVDPLAGLVRQGEVIYQRQPDEPTPP